jgi:hypothetical protein
VTREEQDTERALVRAEEAWLKARGWRLTTNGFGSLLSGARYSHPAAPGPGGGAADFLIRDALALTRADPLRYGRRRAS